MNNLDFVNQTPTRLKMKNSSWYALAFVTTSLQVQGSDEKWKNLFLKDSFNFTNEPITTFKSPGTLVSLLSTEPVGYLETALWKTELEQLDSEINIKPNYTSKFKIKAKAIRFNKVLPKIFID
jgi:hypothetical protein